MEIRGAIEMYIYNEYVHEPTEKLLSISFRKAGRGYAVDFTIGLLSGNYKAASTWISKDDLGPYLYG